MICLRFYASNSKYLNNYSKMAKEFSGKVVLITGASSGIGAGTAIHFSTLGASLSLTGRNLENLKKVSQQCTKADKQNHLMIQADITKEDDQKKIIDQTIQQFGKLDVLVNNAGIFELGTIEESNVEQLDKIFNTNVRAVYQLTKLAVPHLIANKGNIVNVSSDAGLRAFAGILTYCMSKKALDQFTECIALDLAPKQVRVNSVNPGTVVTDIFNRSGMNPEEVNEFLEREKVLSPLRRTGQVKDVAEAIAFLASDKASFITGVHLPVDGGRHVACPI